MNPEPRSPIPPEICTYTLVFDYLLSDVRRWQYFRKAIRDGAFQTDIADLHRHQPQNKTLPGLPVVQYGSISGYAALMGVQRGCDLVKAIQLSGELPSDLYNLRQLPQEQRHTLHVAQTPKRYTVQRMILRTDDRNWLTPRLERDRIAELERQLRNALVSYASDFNYDISQYKLYANIYTYNVYKEKNVYKKIRNNHENERFANGQTSQRNIKPHWLLLNTTFETNLILPPHFSLGKEKASGYGWGTNALPEDSIPNLPRLSVFQKK